MNRKLTVTYILTLSAMAFWGLSFVWTKIVYNYCHPFTVVFFRMLLSSIFLWGWCAFSEDKLSYRKKDIPGLLLLAFFEPFLYFICESIGLNFVTSTVASLMIALIPVAVSVLAFVFIREKLSWQGMLGLFVSLLGVSSLVIDRNMQFTYSPYGIMMMTGAVFSAAGYNIMCAKMVKNVTPLQLIRFQNTAGAVLFFPLFLIFGLKNGIYTELNQELIISMINLSFFSSTLAFLFFNRSISVIGVGRTNVFTYLIPVFTAISSRYMTGEIFDKAKLFSMAVIIFGVSISQFRKSG